MNHQINPNKSTETNLFYYLSYSLIIDLNLFDDSLFGIWFQLFNSENVA